MKCAYSPLALEDLKRVQKEVFEASKSVSATERYISGLMEAVESKAEFPLSGTPLYWKDSFTGYYYVVYKAYIAFYRAAEDGIRVERVLYGKSDYLRDLL